MSIEYPVIIADYQHRWPDQFAEIAAALRQALGDPSQRIEHVGSTSVPGLAAKPIIDIDIVVESEDAMLSVISHLATAGYEHQGDLGIPGRHAFRSTVEEVPRDGSGRAWPAHHLYVCAADNAEFLRHIAFRDYLRAHPEAVAEYAALKYDLATRFRNDRVAYSAAKTEFVNAILRQAGHG